MRTVIYARYSSDNQRDASIEDQVLLCRTRVESEGWQYLQTYSDRAKSGATTLRPGYQKLLEDGRKGFFDIVVAEALDRLSRDQEDVAALFKQLTFAGIKLFTIAEGEISELHVGLKGTMNALYLKDLAQKTHRGLVGRIRDGRSAGGRVYGYTVVRQLDAAGNPVCGQREINDREAAIVRQIFREFAAGRSPAKIAKGLNAERVPGPGGRPWQGNVINGHSQRRNGILRNELYIGRLVWNRQRFLKDPTTGKRVPKLNPRSEWIIKDVSDLRIVDEELWNAAAVRLEEREQSPRVAKIRDSRFWERRRPRYVLTGLIKCRHCESAYTSVGGDYLACTAARKSGTCSNKKGIRRVILEGFVLETLKHHLMHPDLVRDFIAAFHAELNAQNGKRAVAERQIRAELSEVCRRLDGLIEAISDGLRLPELQEKLDGLATRKRDLTRELDTAAPSAPLLHPNLADLYRRKVAELHTALNDPAARDEATTILRSLIDRIVIAAGDEGFEIEFVGSIANMIRIPHGKNATKLDQCESAVVRVAGARNHLYLLFAVPHLFLSNDELEIYNPFHSNVRFRRLHDR
jgi:DNA invertase Pin-like site-specific DNA recombinase